MICQPSRGYLDIVVSNNLVFRNVAFDPASLCETNRQQALGERLFDIFALTVGEVVADAVQNLTAFDLGLRCGDDIHCGSAQRSNGRILKKHSTGHSVVDLEMAKMIRRVEDVQRTRAKFVKIQKMLLGRVRVSAENENSRVRRGSHNVIHNAGAIQKIFQGIPIHGFANGVFQEQLLVRACPVWQFSSLWHLRQRPARTKFWCRQRRR